MKSLSLANNLETVRNIELVARESRHSAVLLKVKTEVDGSLFDWLLLESETRRFLTCKHLVSTREMEMGREGF